MKITAAGLQLRNVGQLAAVHISGTTYMGRLDSVVNRGLTFDLTVGGIELTTTPSHPVEIRRTPALDALVEANWINNDVADLLEEVVDSGS